MTGRRLKLTLILGVLLASGLALLAWTQVWINADVATLGAVQRHLPVPGSTASPALTALALAGLALGGALTIAGPVIRVVLGLLEVLLGVSVFLAAFAAVSDPAAASAGAVTKATGIAGEKSIELGVIDPAVTPWPFVALAAAVVMFALGIAIVATARRWPGQTSRYQAVRLEPAGPAAAGPEETPRDAVDDWDELSRGDDPTSGSVP
ncbi:MAG TPA: Trp biosynthesis-associated membrane protein [Cryobacterium sp.]|nr:Trp biosynthesis-associated membrane protein [Cryobacterium sp.]